MNWPNEKEYFFRVKEILENSEVKLNSYVDIIHFVKFQI